ncbi:proliferation marker protein Ki-67 isoform X10 [Etheostoma cragini]|uniref:proliferation marker protein Ki-67 isoform X10 n=1 Tax=Etheostoma cragini TaxID=417921 RepID=UPI00155E1A46|nr:proliferation marker protein Ki-67 isoform X10 [Etheostoma cragini]
MPLHGKIVVIKRSGGDGTEFPLISTCLIGRRTDCDIRIQLPQVSKEHCKIDLNENKEVILTNLSSVTPTCLNGEALHQSERLKHGDVITVIDRSFRFEYPPPPTPKKRSSKGGKSETLKVLQDQQVGATVTTETGEKRISEVTTDPHLKDGTNNDNIQRPLEKTVEMETKEVDSQSKTSSPFSDLYQMIKKSLDVKTPRVSSASVLQTPTSRFCTPKPGSVRKNDGKPVLSSEEKITPKKDEVKVSPVADKTTGEAENVTNGTPKSVKKQRRSFQVPSAEVARPEVGEAENVANSEATSPEKRSRTPPQRFSACEVEPKSPVRRRSKEAEPAVTEEQDPAVTPTKTDGLRRSSPRNSGKEASKKRKYGEVLADSPTPQMKRKRVSFGGYLCPELFDKRLPPDSPLCKGATPRRSLCVSRPKQSLLRRASAIGLRQEFKEEHPDSPNVAAKMRTPSPKSSKKSPKPRTPSPKAAPPARRSPKSKSPSPARGRSPIVSVSPGVQTPLIKGRFSVSHISTPSPIADDAVTDQVPLVTATPKIPLRRKSMSRETPSTSKSAVKAMRRRSGISRASLKVKNSWADIVRFGPTKPQVAVPAKKTVTKKATKKIVSKPQTPARKLKDHVSTGHADSPVTIVVGRAHKQKVIYPTGAAPRLVTNIALLKKNMKMDEDLSGISEMLKTPVIDRKRRSVIDENDATKTPVGGLATSVVEPSVLNTPEESGEMIVSPLSFSSTVKVRSYNTEAVQRLLDDDHESSIVSDTPALETHSDDCSEQQCVVLKTTSVTPLKQKPDLPECLTGVKRIMKTPRQKAEPVEDLRGKILKTPKQRPEQQECLTGVKRIMKTPRQKAEPVEDIRGRILKTPKQKPEQQECLTGVKRMMTTPRQEPEPVEDIKVELLTTPKQKPEQQCLSGVKRICKTTQQEAEPLEDVQGKLLQTPKALEASDEQTVETLADMQESEDLTEMTDVNTPEVKSSPLVPPKETAKPVETFGIKRQSRGAPEEDFGGLQEFTEEALAEPTGQLETNEVEGQTAPDCDEDVAKEEADANEVVVDDHMEEVPSGHNESLGAVETISQASVDEDISVEEPTVDAADENASGEQPAVDAADENASGEQPTVDAVDGNASGEQPAVDENTTEEQPTVDAVDENTSEEQPTMETATGKVTELDPTATEAEHEKKSVRGRRAKTAEDKREAAEPSEDPVVPAPVRGRRGKKTEAAAPPAVKQTRGRNAKSQEVGDVEPTMEESTSLPPKVVLKPKRGRNAKTASDEQPEMGPEKVVEKTLVTEISTEDVSDQTLIKENDAAPPAEEAVLKPVRGRKTKPTPVEPPQPEPEKNEVMVNESHTADAQPQKSIPSLGKTTRGRQTKPDAVDRNEVMEDTVVAVETEQQSQLPVRARRGRNAKQEEEKLESASAETATSLEPAKKLMRTRKAEQDVRPREVQAKEMVIPEKTEVKTDEQTTVAAKPRRGGRKAKQDPELETPVESTEVQEVTAVSSTDKLKRGRRGKLVTEEAGVTAVVQEEQPDHELEAEKKNIAEPDTPVTKPSRSRGVKTSVKKEVLQAIPAKRARRGAALPLEEPNAESTEPAPTSVEPAKRGRRAAAKPTADNATATGEQPKPAEDSSNAFVEDTQMAKRSVRWKADLEVFDISKVTPVKAARGRKPKLAVQVHTESKNVSKEGNEAEEKDLSDNVEAQPVKRARRGAKVADVTSDEAASAREVQSVEAETLPKTRRGRIAKK